MAYMGPALKGVPEQALTQPGGVVAMRVNPETGLRDSKAEDETELWLRRLRDEAYVELKM